MLLDWSLVLNDVSRSCKESCKGRRVPPGYPKTVPGGALLEESGDPRDIMDCNRPEEGQPLTAATGVAAQPGGNYTDAAAVGLLIDGTQTD